jgi:hypothetical protein
MVRLIRTAKKTVILRPDFGARMIRPSSDGFHFVNGAHPQAENTPHRLRLPGARARQAENRIVGRRTGTPVADKTELKPKPMVEIGLGPIRWQILRHDSCACAATHAGCSEVAC